MLVAALIIPAMCPPSLHAQGPDFSGEWRAGSASVRVEVSSWGPDCGPRPASSQRPGGTVTIRPTTGGRDLSLTGAITLTTAQCWSDNPTLQRLSSQRSSDQWKLTCRTSDRDARGEHGIYSLRVHDADTLERRSVSRYDWQLNASQCKAVVTETQRLTRVHAPPAPERAQDDGACTPGTPDQLRLTPRAAQLQPGESLRLRARVVDADGCAVPAEVTWRLAGPGAARASLRGGLFETPRNAAEAEGLFDVTAEVGSLQDTSRVTVRSIDLSDLIAERVETDRTPTATASRGRAASIRAENGDDETSHGVGWLLGAGALAVLSALIWMVRQQRRMGRDIAGEHPVPLASQDGHTPSAPLPRPTAPEMPRQGEAEAKQPRRPSPREAHTPRSTPPASGVASLICPTCRRGFSGRETQCPTDGAALIPYEAFRAKHQVDVRAQVRACPTCGAQFPADRLFCGKDGTRLAPPA